MSKRKATIEFTPNPENPDHLILHKYLSSLDASISASILEAAMEKFLILGMSKFGDSDRLKIKLVGIESRAKLKCSIEIVDGIVAAIDSGLVRYDSLAESPNVSFDFDEDDDDEPRIHALDDMKFSSERQ